MPQKDTLYGDLFVVGSLEANLIKKTGGTSSQFLKADGSVDSNSYLTSVPTLAQVTTAGNTTTNAITVGGLVVDTDTLVVDSVNNRVGIGTASPVFNLDIYGATLNNPYIRLRTNAAASGGNYANGIIFDRTLGGATNNIGIFTDPSRAHATNADALTFSLINSPYTRLFTIQQNAGLVLGSYAGVNTAPVGGFIISGNVGIGTATDAGYKLDVNGTARVSGNTVISTKLVIGNSTFGSFGLDVYNAGSRLNNIYIGYNGNNLISNNTTFGISVFQEGIGIGDTQYTPVSKFQVTGSKTAASAIARGVYFNNTLVAAANNDVLVGLDINPTFTNGAFTGVANHALRIQNGQLYINRTFTGVNNAAFQFDFTSTSGYNSGSVSIGQYYNTTQIALANGTSSSQIQLSGANLIIQTQNVGSLTFNSRYHTFDTSLASGFVEWKFQTVSAMKLFSTGNLTLGYTSPTDAGYKLNVNGDIALSGNLVPTSGTSSVGTFANRFTDFWGSGLIVGTTFYGDNLQSASGTLYFKEGGGIEKMRMTSGGNFLIGTTTDTGQKLQISGSMFIKGTTSLTATKIFEVQNGSGTSIMDFRDNQYAFFGCGQGGGSASGFIFNYSNTSYTQFSGYNYGAGAGSYKPILMDTDTGGRNQGIFVNFGVTTNTPPSSDTEFAVRGRTSNSSTYISKFVDSSNVERFSIRADGALFTDGNIGYTGTVNFPTNPPGQQNIDIVNGMIVNVF